ncbi:hypothetical protein [Dokdonella sp.]|uniref:hypothetical protein n=1 Tax=Dokdonella sp. TaxID=2291710 RepID=UPI00352827E0
MNAVAIPARDNRYARCIEVSKRICWDIDRDVIRGRRFDFRQKFLPEGLTRLNRLDLLSDEEKKLMSQIQGRTYAYLFGLVERFINTMVLERSRQHEQGDAVAHEALIRFSEEEVKHMVLFGRIEDMIAADMPPGYEHTADAQAVASVVLGKSTWAVLALTCHIELFTQAHYRQSIDPDAGISPLFKDIFLYHWREESQHAILDELEWRREDAAISDDQRDSAVDDLIALVGAIDGILQAQAFADADYFCAIIPRSIGVEDQQKIEAATLAAYRWQYILSGVQEPRFQSLLAELTSSEQKDRIGQALAPLFSSVH